MNQNSTVSNRNLNFHNCCFSRVGGFRLSFSQVVKVLFKLVETKSLRNLKLRSALLWVGLISLYMSVLRFKRSSWGVVQCCRGAEMEPFYLGDSDHNNIFGSDDALQTAAGEETGLDLDTALLPGPQQSGPEVAVVAPSHEAGQPSTFNFEYLLAHAMRNVAESPVQLPWESDEWACIFDPNHDSLDALVPQFEPSSKCQS